jgi:hypothetical protein
MRSLGRKRRHRVVGELLLTSEDRVQAFVRPIDVRIGSATARLLSGGVAALFLLGLRLLLLLLGDLLAWLWRLIDQGRGLVILIALSR